MVAIVSLGAPRALLLRPARRAAASLRYELGHGDLIVMGGSCQRTWEHAVPKTARAGRAADQRPVPPAGRAVRLVHQDRGLPRRADKAGHHATQQLSC